MGGATNAAAGDSFKDGFLSAGFSEAAAPFVSGTRFDRVVQMTIIGGTASTLGGGKFANGAETAAFAYMFNELGSHVPEISGRSLSDNLVDWLTGDSSNPFEGDVCVKAVCLISGHSTVVTGWLPRAPLVNDMPSNCRCTIYREPQFYDPTGAANAFRKQ